MMSKFVCKVTAKWIALQIILASCYVTIRFQNGNSPMVMRSHLPPKKTKIAKAPRTIALAIKRH